MKFLAGKCHIFSSSTVEVMLKYEVSKTNKKGVNMNNVVDHSSFLTPNTVLYSKCVPMSRDIIFLPDSAGYSPQSLLSE
ncbi:hypothetical protein BA1DRAFT_00847 [Photorhabdus aegyptia]|uniref:Uncharacterized protein n=1 Tax=Photorhabdus aegyptia TaxID=2805098 RepID=A0A022PNU7_9GAMM|nr:hypothetical protein BA1DRAFT_00847 [Photorhabdus aegyptia]